MSESVEENSFWWRGGIYVTGALLGSAIGTFFTWTTDAWADANPLTSSFGPVVFSLGPAIIVLAVARVRQSTAFVISGVLAISMIAMWRTFAASDSSTSALVFLWGWIGGIPAALVVVSISLWRSRSRVEDGPAAGRSD